MNCPRCGTPLVVQGDQMVCEKCGFTIIQENGTFNPMTSING